MNRLREVGQELQEVFRKLGLVFRIFFKVLELSLNIFEELLVTCLLGSEKFFFDAQFQVLFMPDFVQVFDHSLNHLNLRKGVKELLIDPEVFTDISVEENELLLLSEADGGQQRLDSFLLFRLPCMLNNC